MGASLRFGVSIGTTCGFVLAATLLPVAARSDEPVFRTNVLNAESTYSACAAVDVNRDGKLDVVCGGWWYEAPAWTRHRIRDVELIRGRYDDYSNLPIDVDGDGWTDLISANYRSSKLAWVRHPGEGLGTWREHVIAVPGPMETGRLADVDGDGQLDVLPNGVKFAAWWEYIRDPTSPTGVRWIRHELPDEAAAHGIGIGDINGDGRDDIVGPRGWAEAPSDRRKDRWIWHPEFTLDRDAGLPIHVFDVDGDGDNDIVWGRGHSVGLYWLEQIRPDPQTRTAKTSLERRWVRHAIDTSVSQYHSLLLADLDNDGGDEVIAGKRYMGHDGRDIGEYDPLVIASYQFDPTSRTWRRRVLSESWSVGFGLDPKAADLDGDGDVDLIAPGRSGLYWLENLLISDAATTFVPPPAKQSPPVYADHSKLLVVHDNNGQSRPVTTLSDWARRRDHILTYMQTVMGPLPEPDRRSPLDVEVIEETDTADYVRQKITYAAEPGDRVPAFLLIPKKIKGRTGAMLCLHQTTRIGKGEPVGQGDKPNLHYAHELAIRGYVCLTPDYPSFGDYKFDFQAALDRYPSGSMKAIWNNMRGVDLLQAMPQVDPDRIGCIGHSLGGHNTMFTAVFDQRIKAMVSSCGFTAFHHYYGGKLAGWTSDRYMPRIRDAYENDPDKVPFDFYEIVAAFAPRHFFVNAPLHDSNFDVAGVKRVIAEAQKIYELTGAGDRLHVEYPDAGHDFPDEIRQRAYEWLDRALQ